MINIVILLGHLGQDPQMRETKAGNKVANFSLATSRRWKDKEGNNEEETQWHRCTVWNQQAEVVEAYLKKGSLVHVEGHLEYEKWADENGQERYSTKVNVSRLQMVGGKNAAEKKAEKTK